MPPPTHHRAIALVVTVVVAIGIARTSSRGQSAGSFGSAHAPEGTDAGVLIGLRRAVTGPIDPNTADLVALEALPGVGPALARRITAARARGALFRRPEDLGSIRGIGPRTVSRLTPWLTFAVADAAVLEGPDTAATDRSRTAAPASP